MTALGELWNSEDGSNDVSWGIIAYGDSTFVAMSRDVAGLGTHQTRCMHSHDGIHWSNSLDVPFLFPSSCAYGAGTFVSFSRDLGPGSYFILRSTDASTWTFSFAVGGLTFEPQSLVYGGGQFVCVSATSDAGVNVLTSPDGVTWTPQSTSYPYPWESITYGDGTYVAVNPTGSKRLMTSVDGISWVSPSHASIPLVSAAYGNGIFVVVASDGRMMKSVDGSSWMPSYSFTSLSPSAVTFGGGIFAVVTSGGTADGILTSIDGVTWVNRVQPVLSSFSSIAFGNRLFVAVSDVASLTDNVICSFASIPPTISFDPGFDYSRAYQTAFVRYGTIRSLVNYLLSTTGEIYSFYVISGDYTTSELSDTILLGDVKVMFPRLDLVITPLIGDSVTFPDSSVYEIINIMLDPAKFAYIFQLRLV